MNPSRPGLIAVAMSGGVDSSVAAAVLARSGVPIIGITLAMWPRGTERERDRGCCSLSAVEDARAVARRIGVRHYAWNLEPEFADEVIADFEAEYLAGRTPNPCVVCNQRIKFGVLLERARQVGATHVATGHYARRRERGDGVVELLRHPDSRKDQSYTLHRLDQEQLRSALFPLGDFATKEAVRAEARALGLATAGKPESQDLCFVDSSVVADLRRRLAGRYRPGPIVAADGSIVGEHEGIPFHTVGQRGRLRVAPVRPDQGPLYVTGIDAERNRITVGDRGQLMREAAHCDRWVWTEGGPPPPGVALGAQLRAHGQPVPARLRAVEQQVVVGFDPPGGAAAPGQSLVLYDGDRVIGGGRVVSSDPVAVAS